MASFDSTLLGGLTPSAFVGARFHSRSYPDSFAPYVESITPDPGSVSAQQVLTMVLLSDSFDGVERWVLSAETEFGTETIFDGDAFTLLYNGAQSTITPVDGTTLADPTGYSITFIRRGGWIADTTFHLTAYGRLGMHVEYAYTMTNIGTAPAGSIDATGSFSLADQTPATNGRDVAIDFETKKWVLINRDFVRTQGGNAIKQSLQLRLLFFLGEWFLDQNVGTDWYGTFFTKPFNQTAAEDMLRARVLGTKGVKDILSFSLDLDRPTRTVAISYTVSSDFGELTDTITKVG